MADKIKTRQITEIRSERDLPENEFRAVITTKREDRHGTTIYPEGADTSAFEDNPVLLFNHLHDRHIGKVLSLQKNEGEIVAHFRVNPRETEIIEDLNEGYLNAMSIGFRSKKRNGNDIEEWELLEISVVTVQSNVGALVSERLGPTKYPVPSRREGKTLSTKNLSRIQDAIEALEAVKADAERNLNMDQRQIDEESAADVAKAAAETFSQGASAMSTALDAFAAIVADMEAEAGEEDRYEDEGEENEDEEKDKEKEDYEEKDEEKRKSDFVSTLHEEITSQRKTNEEKEEEEVQISDLVSELI